MRPPAEPLVVVWRNQIPHRCSLIYWGRKWKYTDREHRLINLRSSAARWSRLGPHANRAGTTSPSTRPTASP